MKGSREVLVQIWEIDEYLPIHQARLLFLFGGVDLGHGISGIQVTDILYIVLYSLSLAVIYRGFAVILTPLPIFTDGFQVLMRCRAIHSGSILPKVLLANLGQSLGRLARIQSHRIVLVTFDHHDWAERDLRKVFDVAILWPRGDALTSETQFRAHKSLPVIVWYRGAHKLLKVRKRDTYN